VSTPSLITPDLPQNKDMWRIAAPMILSNVQTHWVDGCFVGKWENVDALNPVLTGVEKFLANRYSRNEAADFHVDVCVQECRGGVAIGHP